MTLDDITATSPSSWKYVAEGGATMVFSYVGDKNKSFDGMVLRLRKVPAVPVDLAIAESAREGVVNDVKEQEEWEQEEEPDDPVVAFQIICMTRLIPSFHLPRLEKVHVSRNGDDSWLRALSDFHECSRPLSRRKLGGIDTERKKGVLATDLVGADEGGMSVEIKPKWSFLPNPTHLSISTRDIKTRTCRFCMHTHMRAQYESQAQGSVPSRGLQEQPKNRDTPNASHHHSSSYCPLDLFSGSQTRVRRALCSLFDTWIDSDGKANNLKIFVKGKAISVSEKHLMLQPSTSTSDTNLDASIDIFIREAFVDALIPYLTKTSVLQVLNRLQRSLDGLDIEGLRQLWDQWHLKRNPSLAEPEKNKDVPPIGQDFPEPTLEDWSAFIDEHLAQQEQHAKSPETELPVISNEQDLKYHLLAYLLSATFKDCSIMVRMPTLLGSDRTDEQSIGEQIVDPSRVTLIDLDPKSMARLKKWEELDREIVEVYRHTGEGKVCVDDHWCT